MKIDKFNVIKLSLKDDNVIKNISGNAFFKSYLKNHKEIASDFALFIKNEKSRFNYWVCLSGDKLLSLIVIEDLSSNLPDYMIPWVETEKKTLWVSLIMLRKEVAPEEGVQWLTSFISSLPKEVGALLTDPEVKEESTLAFYELAGFVKVNTFIKGQGFFKGTSHYLMKFKI